ncbi:MAG TPA: hypothetical protein VES02_07350 [Dermatophilaceae bacterium]|nr:hypothetical protein [Dermatophilaceae bacterium]
MRSITVGLPPLVLPDLGLVSPTLVAAAAALTIVVPVVQGDEFDRSMTEAHERALSWLAAAAGETPQAPVDRGAGSRTP